MPHPRKSGADWNAIRSEYVQNDGKGVRKLGRDWGLHHSTIKERADKEGWLEDIGGEDVAGLPPVNLPATRQRYYTPASELPEDTRGKKTPARIEAICQAIANGASEATASVLNDITPATLRNWKGEDPEVVSAVLRAFAAQGWKDEKAVNDDVERGNANTALKRLSKNPLAKEHWADNQHGGPGGLHITLNIPLPGTIAPPNGYAQGAEPLTINHEPEAA